MCVLVASRRLRRGAGNSFGGLRQALLVRNVEALDQWQKNPLEELLKLEESMFSNAA